MAEVWSETEIDLIVADYFAMVSAELAGQPFNKAERNRALQQLISRSRGSIEFKHQNISAVMLGLGQPWIEGYKPAANFQNALVDGVLRWLNAHPDWLVPNEQHFESIPHDRSPLWIGPPPAQRNEPPPVDPENAMPGIASLVRLERSWFFSTSAILWPKLAGSILLTRFDGQRCRTVMVLASISQASNRTGENA